MLESTTSYGSASPNHARNCAAISSPPARSRKGLFSFGMAAVNRELSVKQRSSAIQSRVAMASMNAWAASVTSSNLLLEPVERECVLSQDHPACLLGLGRR